MLNNNVFMDIALPIIENEEYQKMKEIEHHTGSTYDHSLDVAYKAFEISYYHGLDWKSAVRGALLHDFFLYEFNKSTNPMLIINAVKHFIKHPKIALNNAKIYFDLNKKEENIIVSHMFPFGLPKSKEAWVVCYSDKYMTINEYFNKYLQIIKAIRKYIFQPN